MATELDPLNFEFLTNQKTEVCGLHQYIPSSRSEGNCRPPPVGLHASQNPGGKKGDLTNDVSRTVKKTVATNSSSGDAFTCGNEIDGLAARGATMMPGEIVG